MADLDLLLEAEKRGMLPADKAPLLEEARKRGMVPPLPQVTQDAAPLSERDAATRAWLAKNKEFHKTNVDPMFELGGKATDLATSAGASPQVAGGVGVATNLATSLMTAGAAAGKAVAPEMEGVAKWLMKTALKPTLKDQTTRVPGLGATKADSAITTMLDEGVNATMGGVRVLADKISNIQQAISSRMQGSAATVDKGAIASRIQDVIQRVERTNPTPQEARASVEKVYDDFIQNQIIPKDIPVAWAQELKQGIYQTIKDSYGKMASATVEAQKALARGFKEEIASAVPGVGELNAAEQKLLTAFKVAQRRALMQGNNNPGGLAILSHSPEMFLSFMADKSALVKSLVARVLYSGSEALPAAGAAATQSAPPLK